MWALGESWHNYHHVYPFDYRSDEFNGPDRYLLNFTTKFIMFCEKIGLAYDLKTASPETIARQKAKSGDGSF